MAAPRDDATRDDEEMNERVRRMTWGPGQEPSISQCLYCRWGKAGLPPTCAAYPQGIPEAILANQHDHHHPYPGDKGIRFEPKPAR